VKRIAIIAYVFGVLIGIIVENRVWAQSGPRLNPATQITSYSPGVVLYSYFGPASGLPTCNAPPATPPQTAPYLSSAALAYITGPPDSIEACMQGTAGPGWVKIGGAQ
jgi:hypothetical protein